MNTTCQLHLYDNLERLSEGRPTPFTQHSLPEILNIEPLLPLRGPEKLGWGEKCSVQGEERYAESGPSIRSFFPGMCGGCVVTPLAQQQGVASRPITFRKGERGKKKQPSLCGARAKPPTEGEESSCRRTSSSMWSPHEPSRRKPSSVFKSPAGMRSLSPTPQFLFVSLWERWDKDAAHWLVRREAPTVE